MYTNTYVCIYIYIHGKICICTYNRLRVTEGRRFARTPGDHRARGLPSG